MQLNRWMAFTVTGITVLSSNALAVNVPQREQVQVPQCLAEKMTGSYEVLAENKQFKVIDVAATDLDALSLLADQVHCGRYVNLSHHLNSLSNRDKKQSARRMLQHNTMNLTLQKHTVYHIQHQNSVNKALQTIAPIHIQETLTHLVSFYNRSALEETGVDTAKWLKFTFETLALASGRTDTATFFVETGFAYKQPSLVTVIGKDLKEPAIVIGAHMDTLGGGRMPGAGDDASGSSSIMEMARVLLYSELTLKRPIYVIWYAAEERGLIGSQSVVNYFQKNAIPVKAAIQFDMTGYRVDANDPSMWVFTDYTNKSLNQFVSQLIETYVQVPVNYSQCGYGCSDHASWTAIGVPAAFPCESNFKDHNPYIHTASDTMDLLSLEHMTNFSKLATAFAIELALE